MSRCQICNKNEANKPGTHIFPAWMIGSAFDSEARNRDFEIIYNLSFKEFDIPYFGRRVSREKIKELIGRELADEEGKSKRNPLILNNVWCSQCEARIKIVEDYFLENVERKTEKFEEYSETDICQLENANKYIIRLFIYTLILRASLAKYLHFELNIRAFNKIKKFINFYLKDSLSDTVKAIDNSYRKGQLLKFPIRLIKTENFKDAPNFVFIHKEYDRPYSLIINRYILQFYGKGNHVNYSKNSFFGICFLISQMKNIKNYKEDVFKLGILRTQTWQSILTKYYDIESDLWIDEYLSLYNRLYRLINGDYPNELQKQEFLIRLTHNDYELNVKYSIEKVIEAMNIKLI